MLEKILAELNVRPGKTEEKRTLAAIQSLKQQNEALVRANLELRRREDEISQRGFSLRNREEEFVKGLNRVREAFGVPALPLDAKNVPTVEDINDTLHPLKEANVSVGLTKALPGIFQKLQKFDSPVSILLTKTTMGHYQARVVLLQSAGPRVMEHPFFYRRGENDSQTVITLRTGATFQSAEEALLSACS